MDERAIIGIAGAALLATGITVATLVPKPGEVIIDMDYSFETAVVVDKTDSSGETYIHAYLTDDELSKLGLLVWYSCASAPAWSRFPNGKPAHVFDSDCTTDTLRHNVIIDIDAKKIEKLDDSIEVLIDEEKKDKAIKDLKIKVKE